MSYRWAGEWITPHQIRAARFATRRSGLDPAQVSDFLAAVADELHRLQLNLSIAETELARMKHGLRQWQARHIDCRVTDSLWSAPPNRRRW